MATRFELLLDAPTEVGARAVAEAAWEEIDRIEFTLSAFLPESELNGLNHNAAASAVPVDPRFFAFLELARKLTALTGGAFDPTIAPLLTAWGLRGPARIAPPSTDELNAAQALVGWENIVLDAESLTVRYAAEGVSLDFGGLGKGYALDRAATIVGEAGIVNALLHAGTSSVIGLGVPPEAAAWKVAIAAPPAMRMSAHVAVATLHDTALSVSAQHGRGVVIAGVQYWHTIDPRRSAPADTALLAATVAPTATQAEAFSTAMLITGAGHGLLVIGNSTTITDSKAFAILC